MKFCNKLLVKFLNKFAISNICSKTFTKKHKKNENREAGKKIKTKHAVRECEREGKSTQMCEEKGEKIIKRKVFLLHKKNFPLRMLSSSQNRRHEYVREE